MISVEITGSTNRTRDFLTKMQHIDADIRSVLESAGRRGVAALSAATPVDSNVTAMSWSYEVEIKNGVSSIWWSNTNVNDGSNIAILLQYGHGTGTGGWVTGRDYINPAIKPIFDEISNDVWKKVTSA